MAGGRELIRSRASLETFAAETSHDLQGPFAAVRLALQGLHERGLADEDADAQFLLSTALEGTRRMRRTVDDVLALALLRGPRSAERIDLTALTHAVVADLSGSEAEAQITVGDLPALHGHPPGVPAGDAPVVPGSGVDLATCARIVHSRGGKIGVESAEGGGSVFWFELPMS